ncbi:MULTISPECIES: hypothetical protein [Mesorhizobium]|uniref:head-tail connector protein n=1 Tax=Mesorhizobium TaxID=68287 RepID=UPI0007A94A45|nr:MULTISPECIES: hypothetical protein [Mesorhizobium]AMX93625.1 hypothetical protein A4R28_11210 [Mesorhizobium ciceri]MDF3208315.1 hypothetical protein [Mesorhizobium sp. LMG15046]MDF3229113.1 hypothetical protein [Mesorhizobium sp. DSM 30133]RUU22221.1 hypothetical protein EOC84_03680 [Mesorhizobium sp. Primo-B]RUU37869.1 hypothetical protein EOC83_16535 [Mesorhizobium sp. Primo-A]
MLDIEIVTPPTDEATDIVSVAELKRHLRISSTIAAHDTLLGEILEDVVDKLHGIGGELNRTLLTTTYKRYMTKFPGNDECGKPLPILLPYPPLISLGAIMIEDGSSPDNVVDSADYVVKSGMLVPEVHPVSAWPSVTAAPRAVSVTYTAGYAEHNGKVKRMVKFLAGHYFENTEATILEQNKTLISRNVLFAMDDLRAALKISNSYDSFNED